jgi:hypothetical protein
MWWQEKKMSLAVLMVLGLLTATPAQSDQHRRLRLKFTATLCSFTTVNSIFTVKSLGWVRTHR